MKSNWQIKKLEEVCEVFADGDWIEKKDQSISGIRLIQTGNIGNGYFLDRSEKARYISEDTFKRLRCTEVLPGDCLLSRLPDPVGRASLIPGTGHKMITAVDCTIMRFKKDTLPKWFIYYSLSPDYQKEINKEVTGATRQRISRSNLGNIEIPVPPIPEQKRIVKILDEVFKKNAKIKEKAENNLQNARELFESYLQSIFTSPSAGWEEKKLGEVCHLITDGKHGDCENEESSGYYFLSAKDIKNNTLQYASARQITKKDFEETHRRTDLKPGDVLVTNSGTIGRMAIAPVDHKTYKTTFQKSVAIIKPMASIIDSVFCCYRLRADLSKLVSISAGTAQKNLLIGDLKNYIVHIPPLSVQRAIVVKLDALSTETKKLEAVYQQKLADLEELKKSILQKAFKGELKGCNYE